MKFLTTKSNFYSMSWVAVSTLAMTLGFSAIASAATFSGFTGAYDPGNWSLKNTKADNGNVDISNTPSSITLVGGDDGINVDPEIGTTDWTIISPANGQWSFNWSFQSFDSLSGLDEAGVVINSIYTPIVAWDANSIDSTTFDPIPLTGIYNQTVNAGDQIGFRVLTRNNSGGPGEFTVSNLTVESADVPFEFSPTLGLGILATGFSYRRWQRRRQG